MERAIKGRQVEQEGAQEGAMVMAKEVTAMDGVAVDMTVGVAMAVVNAVAEEAMQEKVEAGAMVVVGTARVGVVTVVGSDAATAAATVATVAAAVVERIGWSRQRTASCGLPARPTQCMRRQMWRPRTHPAAERTAAAHKLPARLSTTPHPSGRPSHAPRP